MANPALRTLEVPLLLLLHHLRRPSRLRTLRTAVAAACARHRRPPCRQLPSALRGLGRAPTPPAGPPHGPLDRCRRHASQTQKCVSVAGRAEGLAGTHRLHEAAQRRGSGAAWRRRRRNCGVPGPRPASEGAAEDAARCALHLPLLAATRSVASIKLLLLLHAGSWVTTKASSPHTCVQGLRGWWRRQPTLPLVQQRQRPHPLRLRCRCLRPPLAPPAWH